MRENSNHFQLIIESKLFVFLSVELHIKQIKFLYYTKQLGNIQHLPHNKSAVSVRIWKLS